MSIQQAAVTCVAALLASVSVGYAGPCKPEIAQVYSDMPSTRHMSGARQQPARVQRRQRTASRRQNQLATLWLGLVSHRRRM
jgi:hypothetical protein